MVDFNFHIEDQSTTHLVKVLVAIGTQVSITVDSKDYITNNSEKIQVWNYFLFMKFKSLNARVIFLLP